jgi:hypothetical protein
MISAISARWSRPRTSSEKRSIASIIAAGDAQSDAINRALLAE